MAEHAHAAGAPHAHPSYVKIWAILLALLAISILGPMLGVMWITLITAFGIAVVKAVMVAAYFMHLNIERTYIKYMLLGLLALMLVLFTGVAPDVMKRAGTNWRNSVPERSTAPAPAARH